MNEERRVQGRINIRVSIREGKCCVAFVLSLRLVITAMAMQTVPVFTTENRICDIEFFFNMGIFVDCKGNLPTSATPM
jgi:hypothetical protein